MATIYNLLQTSAARPDLIRGIPPEGLLTAAEASRFYALKTGKRRREWLLGRWTAKRLLQRVMEKELGEIVPLDSFTIDSAPDGSPHGRLGSGAYITLSISHRDDQAFCALAPGLSQLGADVERVEPRADGFVKDYMTTEEVELLASAPTKMHDLLVTATWSGKEAALKALRLGLTVDTRAVTCLIEPPKNNPETWTPFPVRFGPRHMTNSDQLLNGWWRCTGDYVLTLVAEGPCDIADIVAKDGQCRST